MPTRNINSDLKVNANLTLPSLPTYSGSQVTALMIAGADVVGKRALGTNAFNSTSYLPLAGGNMTGDINLGTGKNIYMSGTSGLRFVHDGSNGNVISGTGDLNISNGASDKDIKFKGNDGGSSFTALTLDMSAGGNAIFNGYVVTSLVYGNTDLNLGYAGGTSGIFIKGSTALAGNVGIGTTHPQAKLHIDDNASLGTGLLVTGGGQGGPLAKFTRDVGGSGSIEINSSGSDPQIQFASSSNTFSLGTNSSTFEICDNNVVGNNTRLSINSSGNVGIGTNNPTSILDIRDTQTGGASEIKLFNLDQGNTTTQTSALRMSPDLRANGVAISAVKENADFSSSANKDVAITFSPVLNNAAAEKMRITSAGNVGIGTTSPDRPLTINSDTSHRAIRILENDSANESWDIGVGVDGDLNFFNSANANPTVIFSDSGNVGIGTTSVDEKLHVQGNIKSNHIYAETYRSSRTDGEIYIQAATSNDFVSIGTEGGNNNILRVQGDGNVGIGTTSPAYRLHVSGTIGLTSSLYFTNNTAGIQVGGSWGNGVLNFRNGVTTAITFDVPNNRIQNNLGKYLTASSGTGQFGTLDNQSVAIVANNSTKMTILSGGNVGIGTVSPAEKLEVAGNILAKDSGVLAGANGAKDGFIFHDLYTGGGNYYGYKGFTGPSRLSIVTNGIEGLTIDANSNVGIGVGGTNPDARLRLKGAGGSSGLTFKTTDFSNNEIFYIMDGGRVGVRYWPFSIGVPSTTSLATNASFQVEEAGLLTVLTTGNVGIGTTTPAKKLEVNSGSGNTDGIRITGSGANTSLIINNTGSNGVAWDITSTGGGHGYGDGSLNFGVAFGLPKMKITNTGNVGIGTTSPAAKLQVYSTATRDIFISGHGTQAQNDWTGEHAFFISAGQGVIIGKANANNNTNRLHILYNDSSGNANYLAYNTSNTAKIHLNTNGNSYLNGGNVGIGTISPSYPLEVANAASVSIAYLRTGASAKKWGFHSDSANTYWQNLTDNILALTVSNAGNVGIGAIYPATKLHLAETTDVYLTLESTSTGTPEEVAVKYNNYSTGSNYWWQGLNQSANWSLGYGTSFGGETTKLFVNTDGNVGIGTTSPDAKLVASGIVDGDFTALRLMNQKTYGSGTGTNEKVRFVMGISENGHNFSAREGFAIDVGIINESDSSNTIVNFGVRDGGTLGTYQTVNGHNKSVDFVGNVTVGGVIQCSGSGASSFTGGVNVGGALNINSGSSIHGTISSSSGSLTLNARNTAIMLFQSGGSEKMRIASSGNVGIGTTSPTNILHTYTSSNTVGRFESSDSDAHIRINDNADSLYVGTQSQRGYIGSTSANSNSNLTIDLTNGNVGIGTTSPASKLEVNGQFRVVGAQMIGNSATSNVVTSGVQLHVKNTGEAKIRLEDSDSSNLAFDLLVNKGVGFSIKETVGGDSGDDTRLFIQETSGNVGIGTDSPKGKLNVLDGTSGSYSPDSEADTMVIESSVAGGISLIGTGSGSAQKQKLVFGTTGDTTGAVVMHDPNNSFMSVGTTTASNYLKLLTGDSTEAMRLAANGNVGIGTTSPATKLHVEGTIAHKVYTVSTLPSASPAGQRAFVSDSSYSVSQAHGLVTVGSGSNFCPMYSDGTNWRVG